MPSPCTLTIEPLSTDILLSFKPIPIQAEFMLDTIRLFEDGFPPHQAALVCNGEAVLIMGLMLHEEGVYWSWTIFGVGFRPIHYKALIRFFNDYLNHLEWTRITHIIDKRKPWTRHMIKAMGFSFTRDHNDEYEWWDRWQTL